MDIELAKFNMVEQQIRPWNVLNQQVLETMTTVPRENFVPPQHQALAFADINVPIGDGQVMLQPKVEARLLQALELQRSDSVLQIGTGTGFAAALLATMAKHVESVEIRENLASQAQNNLLRNGIDNVDVVQGDASRGWRSEQSYDCIFISGSVVALPDAFVHALNDSGRLVAIVGGDPVMNAVLVERIGSAKWDTAYLFETHLPALDNIARPDQFQF